MFCPLFVLLTSRLQQCFDFLIRLCEFVLAESDEFFCLFQLIGHLIDVEVAAFELVDYLV